jgi:transcriptional regulator with XRE-family HTH domain
MVNSLLDWSRMAENKTNQAPDRFIRRLQKAMKEHPEKLSLNEIARRADLSPAYLSFLLNGKRNVPSNDAIARLAEVLNIPQDELHHAAGKPDDAALDFFRKDEAGPIMRSLAKVPAGKLPAVRTWIEQFVQDQKRARGK